MDLKLKDRTALVTGASKGIGFAVAEIDYVLVDPYLNPEDSSLLIERPFLMPESWVCLGRLGFHDGLAGDPTGNRNLLGGGVQSVVEGDFGATGAPAARRALLDAVIPFYNFFRFGFGFTQEEMKDLAEFVLSL